MNPSATLPSDSSSVDEDLVEQARPGHGVPSQDPDPAAQIQLEPQEEKREARSTLVGGGMVAGMATGAAIGVAVAGPVGVLVGATLGAAAGALGGAAAGATAKPDVPSSAAWLTTAIASSPPSRIDAIESEPNRFDSPLPSEPVSRL